MSQPLIIFIDLFCGAGGVTQGAVQARLGKHQPVKVIACVNHDPLAIESHEYNHPGTLHFSEDIRTLNVLPLKRLVEFYREKYPNAIVVLWASMECTNYSKAKGGLPRDADSRSLPDEMDRYIEAIDPDYFKWENVEEFMSWGPLDKNGRPVSRKNGREWLAWQKRICSMGYRHEWKLINSADFGAYTKRNRLFGIFAREGMPIVWPDPTHAENPDAENMFGAKQSWNPVREVLDFEDEGKSIFTRSKPLVENTLKRIYAGLQKYVATGDGFLMKYYGNGDNVESMDRPCGAIRTKDCFTKVKAVWLDKQYRSQFNHQSINRPAGAILSNDKHCKVSAHFLARQFSGGGQHQSVNTPAGTVLTVPKMDLVSAYLMNPQFSSKGGSIEDPCFTLIARMDKRPPSLIQAKLQAPFILKWNSASKNSSKNASHSVEEPCHTVTTQNRLGLVQAIPWLMNHTYQNPGASVNEPAPTLLASRRHYYLNQAVTGSDMPECLKVKKSDTPTMKLIKEFCFKYGICDILTRMLKVSELKLIQGFPDDYYLAGNQTDQKKFIGNSVVPVIPKKMMEALAIRIKEQMKVAA